MSAEQDLDQFFEEAVASDAGADNGSPGAPAEPDLSAEPEGDGGSEPTKAEAKQEAGADENAPPAPSEPEAIDWEKRYQEEKRRAESLRGNLDKVKAERDEYRGKMESQGKPAATAEPAATKPDLTFLEDFDDEDKSYIAKFIRKHPEVAKATLGGNRGATWAKILVDHGEDQVLAQYDLSQSFVQPLVEQIPKVKEEVALDLNVRSAQAHFDTIAQTHPDWVQVLGNSTPQDEQDIWNPELIAWIDDMPSREARPRIGVLQSGNAQQVIALVSEFKEFLAKRGGGNGTQPTKPQPNQRKSQAAMAVTKQGSTPLPRGQADPNDMDAAWEEATAGL